MNFFKVNGTDFGIGKVVCEIENDIIKDLTIVGDKNIGRALSEDENGEWYCMPYAPLIFFSSVPFEKNTQMEIDDELLDEYDISFVFHEHNDVYGTLTINDNHILINGEVRQHMNDEKLYSLEIAVDR